MYALANDFKVNAKLFLLLWLLSCLQDKVCILTVACLPEFLLTNTSPYVQPPWHAKHSSPSLSCHVPSVMEPAPLLPLKIWVNFIKKMFFLRRKRAWRFKELGNRKACGERISMRLSWKPKRKTPRNLIWF